MTRFAWLLLGLLVLNSAYALDKALETQLLGSHNDWRAKVGVSPLKWSADVAKVAQTYANQLAKNGCSMDHSDSDYGENIYWASAQRVVKSSGQRVNQVQAVSGEAVVNAWGSEVEDYDYASNTCAQGAVCGHYTQVVWSNTKTVGCGMALCADKAQVWVCNYAPAGNFMGEKPY